MVDNIYTNPSGISTLTGILQYISGVLPEFFPMSLVAIFAVMYISQVKSGILKALLSSTSFTWVISLIYFRLQIIQPAVVMMMTAFLLVVIGYAFFEIKKY